MQDRDQDERIFQEVGHKYGSTTSPESLREVIIPVLILNLIKAKRKSGWGVGLTSARS